jgi:hypothetical protein
LLIRVSDPCHSFAHECIDPLFNPPGDYGGPTQSMTLQAGSPALQAGDPTQVDGTTDQRELARIVNGFVDIGATETQPGEAAFSTVHRHR